MIDVESYIGPVAFGEYVQVTNAVQRTRLVDWITNLPGLSARELFDECANWIYQSAACARFSGTDDVHCRASACYYEAHRRHVDGLGHDEYCKGDTIYSWAYNQVVSDEGYFDMVHNTPCSCGVDNG